MRCPNCDEEMHEDEDHPGVWRCECGYEEDRR
jgi:ribosomal protein L37AE/L43A